MPAQQKAGVNSRYDLFKLARFMGVETPFVLIEQRKVLLVHGEYSNCHCILAAKPDGSCVFEEKGCCSIHAAKPAVCALFPLGRICNAVEKKYFYVWPKGNACNGVGRGFPITAKEWLQKANVTNEERCHAAYEAAYVEIVLSLRKIKRRFRDEFRFYIIWALFSNFGTEEDYLTQLEENMSVLRPMLEEARKRR